MSTDTLNISSILHEVGIRRRRENYANAFKLLGIFFLAFAVAGAVMLLVAPHRAPETLNILAFTLLLLTFGTIDFAWKFMLIFWPFLLYFWANINMVRQRTLLSLIQTAVESGKPLQKIVRAYAASCFSTYAARLNRFAAALESGHTLDSAVRTNQGLFRYDVASMIRLGGGATETLRSLETIAQDERDFSTIRTYNVFRICFLCALFIQMLLIMTFVFLKITPHFEAIFMDFDTQLPAMTTAVIVAAQWFAVSAFLIMPLVFFLAVIAVVYMILQTNVVIFRPFGLRRMFRSTDAAKFLMVFAAGIRHRFPIPAILEMYRWTVPSDYLRRKGAKIQKAVERGCDWIDAVRRAGFINEPEASLLQSANRTGNTVAVLDQLALSKERSQIRKDDLFSKLAFIVLIFLLGAVIGTFVIAMFMPLITLITSLSAV